MSWLIGLKRCSWDLLMFLAVVAFWAGIPDKYLDPGNISPKIALLATFLTKGILVSCGFVHAHITRKVAFGYINFKNDQQWGNNALIIALYVIFIYAWSHGG